MTERVRGRYGKWQAVGTAGAALVSAFLLAVLSGCGGSRMPETLVIFVSADTRGFLEPCGCRRDQAGGLAARAAIIQESKVPDRLIVDAGNLTAGGRPHELLKMKYLAEGMRSIGYDAVNIGRTEAGLDRDTLRALIRDSGLPFVSANVVDKRTRELVAPASLVVRRGALRIGVTGVTAIDSRDTGPGLDVRPAAEALAEVVPDLKRQCDYLVVLAFLSDAAMRDLAAKFHEVNCVLGGDVLQASSMAEEVNRAIVFSAADRGKVIGEIELRRDGDQYAVESSQGIKALRDRSGAPKEMADLLARYRSELRERRYELASSEGMEAIAGTQGTADEFAGDNGCVSCHPQSHQIAAASAHRRAYETLLKSRSEYDPECLPCHTVGYGLHSGFVDVQRTPQLAGVQCESCHGRARDHSKLMADAAAQPTLQAAAATAASRPSNLRPVTQATCIRCHDKENSEAFTYAGFWPKIAHQKDWPGVAEFWRAQHAGRSAERGGP